MFIKRNIHFLFVLFGFTAICLLAGCSSTKKPKNPDDPYESYNRAMFKFNDTLDRAIIKPTARLYNKIVPRPINNGIDNMLNNLNQPIAVVNDLLQANFYAFTSDSWRFVINSTIGVAGFFDIATKAGLPDNPEGFGLTLAKWGYKKSNYFVVPLFGPRTIRDTIGIPVNYFTSLYPFMNATTRNTIFLLYLVDKRAQLLRFDKVYDEVAIDPYVFQRNAYLQHRNYEIKRTEELDDPYTEREMTKIQDNYYLDE